MSSMRNAVPRPTHRERAQPAARAKKWGLLEKHKDYSLRAQDYNLKKRKLAQLSQKAKERNPDEFAFGMLSSEKSVAGKHGRNTETNRLGHDAVKLMKSQDAGYLRVVAGRGRREIERLEESFGIDGAMSIGESNESIPRGEKIMFLEDESVEEHKRKKRKSNGQILRQKIVSKEQPTKFGPTEITDEPEEDEILVEHSTPPRSLSKKALEAAQNATQRLRIERKRRKRLNELRAAKLEALKRRQKEILAAADQLELQRAKMARTIGGVNKNGVKFKIRERKR